MCVSEIALCFVESIWKFSNMQKQYKQFKKRCHTWHDLCVWHLYPYNHTHQKYPKLGLWFNFCYFLKLSLTYAYHIQLHLCCIPCCRADHFCTRWTLLRETACTTRSRGVINEQNINGTARIWMVKQQKAYCNGHRSCWTYHLIIWYYMIFHYNFFLFYDNIGLYVHYDFDMTKMMISSRIVFKIATLSWKKGAVDRVLGAWCRWMHVLHITIILYSEIMLQG